MNEIDLYKGECFISASDILSFQPIIKEQALLELLRIHCPHFPITGKLILSLNEGYEIKCKPYPPQNGFIYSFRKVENTVVEKGLFDELISRNR